MIIPYFEGLISARKAGHISDHVHLGLFDDTKLGQSLEAAQIAMSAFHLAHLGACDGDTIVDVGCGFGGTLRMLDAALNTVQLIGVNVDPLQIALAKEGAWRNDILWQLCDAAQFSQGREGWADRILSLEALFHFPDPRGFFDAASAALRPGGRLVFSTICFADAEKAADVRAAIRTVCQGYGPWPLPETTENDLCILAFAAGFELMCLKDISALCLAGFEWMAPPCPAQVTDNPIIELRRLFENGQARYALFSFAKRT